MPLRVSCGESLNDKIGLEIESGALSLRQSMKSSVNSRVHFEDDLISRRAAYCSFRMHVALSNLKWMQRRPQDAMRTADERRNSRMRKAAVLCSEYILQVQTDEVTVL